MEKLVKFGFVGILNTLINMVVYNILLFCGLNYIFANSIGYGIGMINSYIWNNVWVFKTKSKSIHTIIKFIIVNLIVLGINNGLLFILVKEFDLNKTVAQILVIVVTTLINFVGSKLWTFKEKEQ
ncbi:MAG: GtrA family protein [Clostridium sp.]|uniref:GtrA family protein n=1 Tax=Clostridium sp. TaxID=1506 RepID=UPI003F361CB6